VVIQGTTATVYQSAPAAVPQAAPVVTPARKVEPTPAAAKEYTVGVNTGSQDSARITVKLPADAKLYVDGVLCPMNSDTRAFDTPKLASGQSYHYQLKADVVRDGKTTTANRRIDFEAGQSILVEFNNLPRLQTVSR